MRCSRPAAGRATRTCLTRTSASRESNPAQRRVAAPWQRTEDGPKFTAEEANTLSLDQLAFLERKRRGVMPQGSVCPTCKGEGTLVCHRCSGSGVNAYAVDEEIFSGEVKQNNGLLNTRTFFMKDLPCWLCRGRTTMSCSDCEGAGFRGVSQLYSGD